VAGPPIRASFSFVSRADENPAVPAPSLHTPGALGFNAGCHSAHHMKPTLRSACASALRMRGTWLATRRVMKNQELVGTVALVTSAASGIGPASARGFASNPGWTTLYRLGAAAAIGVLVLVPFQMLVFVTTPPPSTVTGWFALFDRSPLLGLLDMDLLLIVDQVLIAVMFLALCVALRRANPSWMAIALLFAVAAFAAYLASNPAFEMLALSQQHAAATTDSGRNVALAAGQAMVASWTGTAFSVGYVLGALAFLIAAVVMLRSDVFGRVTGWVGVVFGVASLVPASAGTVGIVFSLVALVPMWIWLILIARRLLQLGRPRGSTAATTATTGHGDGRA